LRIESKRSRAPDFASIVGYLFSDRDRERAAIIALDHEPSSSGSGQGSKL
jgi:hypothetical protein